MSVIGGGDLRMLVLRPFTETALGSSVTPLISNCAAGEGDEASLNVVTDGVLRCLLR